MKRILFVCFLFVTAVAVAQDEKPDYSYYEQGKTVISLGAGFPNTSHEAIDIGTNLIGVNDDSGESTPFYMINGEYGFTENVGLGLYAGYFKSENTALQAASALALLTNLNVNDIVGSSEFSVFSVGGKLSAHYPLISNLDTYASTYVGYNFVNDDINLKTGLGTVFDGLTNQIVSGVNYPTITYEVNAGAKYFFSKNVGIYGEAGIGRFLANLGLSIQF